MTHESMRPKHPADPGDDEPNGGLDDAGPNAPGHESERHSTNLELFIDLVFVFAISKLSKLLGGDITIGGIARALVVAWTVWWVWEQFAWLGTAVDLDRDNSTRLTFLVVIVPTLFMAIAIPDAFGEAGPQFGLAVLAVSVWALVLQTRSLWGDPDTRGAFVQYASLAVIGPVVIGIGGFLDPAALRPWVWAGAALFGIAGAMASGRRGKSAGEAQWRIDPVHFSERHALFVIIVLGEVLVAIGAVATGRAMTWPTGWAIVATAYLATVLFWSYFGFIAQVGETMLREGDGQRRAAIARSFFSFGHFPLVAGGRNAWPPSSSTSWPIPMITCTPMSSACSRWPSCS